jgi:hypothetical protein
MTPRSAVIIGTAALGLAAGTAGRAILSAERPPPAPHLRLTDGERSIDGLLDKFRHALATNDKALLRRLRVTEDEYRDLIMPGSADPGKPSAQYNEQASQYFWGVLNGKSIYVEANLLHDFGGKDLTIDSVEYRKGIKKYRDYTAYKQLTLMVKQPGEEPERMRIGSIAEVDGWYKFISYVRD